LEFFLGLWIAILNQSLNLELVVFIAIFADVATLAIAYDNAPFSKTPVKWNLPKLWGMSILLGAILAVGTWITLTTMFGKSKPDSSPVIGQGVGGGIVQNFGVKDEILFLEISLSENWLSMFHHFSFFPLISVQTYANNYFSLHYPCQRSILEFHSFVAAYRRHFARRYSRNHVLSLRLVHWWQHQHCRHRQSVDFRKSYYFSMN
jgi:hypothetical protein